jgi:hypothetical protein
MRFYKFRSVGKDLDKDSSLDALVNSRVHFSSRNNFNDPFDSKILLPHPTPEEVMTLSRSPAMSRHAPTIRSWIAAGDFSDAGVAEINKLEKAMNELIDTYPIYCLSAFNDDDLLWGHYASAHWGFCIEFEFPDVQPEQMIYQKTLTSIPLLNFIETYYCGMNIELANQIHAALHVKKRGWEYEGEYRWIAANEMGQLSKGQKSMPVQYPPDWVKAIIFGSRASEELKAFIRAKLPSTMQYRQATERTDHIEIVDCKEC